jgi:PKD repeat protein
MKLMKTTLLLILTLGIFSLTSCKKDNPQLGDPPSVADATFSYAPSAANPNIIDFTAPNGNMVNIWDFGNGLKGEGANVQGIYPNAGTYTVTLTVFNQGGNNSTSQEIVIDQTDLSLLDNPYYNALTGGADGAGFKTWYIDSNETAHFGVGPDPVSPLGDVPEWWSAGPNDKPGCGLYDDRYTFHLDAFKFDMATNGDVYIHNSFESAFPGSFQNLGDFTAPYEDQLGEQWSVVEEDGEATLTVSNNSFIGFYTGVRSYKILSITDSTMSLQYDHEPASEGLHWYLKLRAE